MMKLLAIVLLAAAVATVSGRSWQKEAEACTSEKCKLPDCKCASYDIPGGIAVKDAPQFVVVNFDRAVTGINVEFIRKSIYNRVNPDKCPASATMMLTHDNTDYALVHELNSKGIEIGLGSISTFFTNVTADYLSSQYGDQKLLINKFSKVAAADLKGMRMPQSMGGNNQFSMMQKNSIMYDYTRLILYKVEPGLWPYTSDFLADNGCPAGQCPTESFPKIWTVPRLGWLDEENVPCSVMDACVNVPDNADGMANWMMREFNRQYKGNKAPVTFYATSAWFLDKEYHLTAFNKFLDNLSKLPDVFVVSPSQVIDWVKTPKKVSDMIKAPKCPKTYQPNCSVKICKWISGTFERYMTSCVDNCPKSYPGLNNPLGDK